MVSDNIEVTKMAFIRKNGRYIRNIDFIKDFVLENTVIYEKITVEQAGNIGLEKIGDVIIPPVECGPYCFKNVYGYAYADKTRPKEIRIVATFYMHPYGNTDADEVLVDISRACYPKIEVAPYEIEIVLVKHEEEIFATVNMNEQVRKKYLKEAISIMLELFGGCNISDEGILKPTIKRSRVDWIMLPPGKKPSEIFEKKFEGHDEHKCLFIYDRLKTLEKYEIEEFVEGINSFQGYVAYLAKEYCILESAIYGNATYILKRENWKEMSKKSKEILLNENNVVAKIEHVKNWKANLKNIMISLGINEL